MSKLTSYRSWESDFKAWAYRTQEIEVFKSASFKMTSDPGETEGEFRARLQLAAHERRDELSEKLRKKYSAKAATLKQQALRAEQAVEREAEQSRGRKMQTAISFGSTVLGAFLGRKALSTGTLGRATTTMRDVGRSLDESGDVKRAEERLAAVKQKEADLEAEFQAELDELEAQTDPMTEKLETVLVRPRKSDISVDSLGLVWLPYWRDAAGSLASAET
jgi:Sec-independent protein translocase protein TatA